VRPNLKGCSVKEEEKKEEEEEAKEYGRR